ncbi:MAG: ABC transporter ATP-binding protein [Bacteroidales bacterium]|jgi:ABC-type lipoprotein export system ATPase subunit|nr:ABC transporter ATP-binding protein [Bacteroidales bacterium]
MIKLSGIVKTYPDGNHKNYVLRGVNLSIGKGEFIAIMGASGSGKTTLLSILGTLMQPDSGSYLLDGEAVFAVRQTDYSAIRNRKIGFVFQEHRLLPQLCVLDNILLPALAFQSKTTVAQSEYAQFLMEMTGIASLAGQYPSSISGGEAGRAALCRALVMKPALLLADEPAGQLDAENARNITSLLQKINRELGTTALMVSHSAEMASAAGRILTLKNGLLS